jgi:sarcosine oxidase subunit alpha
MTQVRRIANGGRIDRGKPVGFTFNGRRFQGFLGDTLASALLANGQRLVARSFKYHRPRGIFACGPEEPNALVQLEAGAHTVPNLRATQVELYDGLTATSVNAWPSAAFDLQAVNDLFAPLLPAGFYYKTFMWPPRLWHWYESVIRGAAGIGRAPALPDPDTYDHMHVHCDVLVVGGGPAGISAALAAMRCGARVVLADEQNEFGGALLGARDQIDGGDALDWVSGSVAELAKSGNVRVLSRTTAFGHYDHNHVALIERRTDHLGPASGGVRQRVWKVRARQVVLATGAHERPVAFRGNDRPGVMLASAAAGYVNRYAVRPGRKAVVFATNDGAYRSAVDMADGGIEVIAIVDPRPGADQELPSGTR